MVHKHSKWGSNARPCHTVCGLPCDSVEVEYQSPDRITCADCLTLPDRRA